MEDPNKSPFITDWSDPNQRDRYIFHARENYESNKQMAIDSRSASLGYAKWLLASLLAMHSGAIYFISGLRTSLNNSDLAQAALLNAAINNVAGIVFTILIGVFAWMNFQASEKLFSRLADPATIYRDDWYPKLLTNNKTDPITATYYFSIVCTALSVLLILTSSSEIFNALSLANPSQAATAPE